MRWAHRTGRAVGRGRGARSGALALALAVAGCPPDEGKGAGDSGAAAGGATGDDGETGADGGAGDDGETGDDGAADGDDGGTGTGLPASPAPFTLQLSGALDRALVFDSPSCSHLEGSTSFRQFWRGDGHVFVLIIEMVGTFPEAGGPGAWTAADGARVKLQEEAGGDGNFFQSDPADPALVFTLEGFDTDADEAWGTATVGALLDAEGASLALDPQPLPVWCAGY